MIELLEEPAMTELEAFFDAYVECAFWSSRVNNCIPEEDPTPLDEFFEPADGQPHEGESAITLTRRIMAEVRERAPAVRPGRS